MTSSPIPTLLPELKESLSDAAVADYFALAYLQLCVVSYQPPSEIARQVADPKIVEPWGNGRWSCTWGPAQDADGANLAFVATYVDSGSNLPVASVVVIRGTDGASDAWGDLVEAFEDLMVLKQVPLPWHDDTSVKVAEGTLDALSVIQGLQSGGRSLLGYLVGFQRNPANERPVLVVTGHSLGGCLTTVVAPWLKWQLARAGVTVPVVPCSFAAPTAGNAAFANYFAQTFSYCPRYVNDLDVVPLAWNQLSAMKTLYDTCGLRIPTDAAILIDGFEVAMSVAGVSYAQSPTNNAVLKSTCAVGVRNWFVEVATQHHSWNYLSLMKTGKLTTVPVQPRPRTPRSGEGHEALGLPEPGVD